MVVVVCTTCYLEAVALFSLEADEMTDALIEEICSQLGFPYEALTHQKTNFTSVLHEGLGEK